MTSFDLRQVKLRPGEQLRDELQVELSPFDFGGQRYLPAQAQDSTLTIVKIADGTYVHFGKVALTTPENAGDIVNLGIVVGHDAAAVRGNSDLDQPIEYDRTQEYGHVERPGRRIEYQARNNQHQCAPWTDCHPGDAAGQQ